MSNHPVPGATAAAKTVVIVGGGFSGAVFGLKLHRQCPGWRIIIAEPKKGLGRGVAYGACGPDHLLNVPVSRMEIGLTPSFAEWLQRRRAALAEALVESGLDLSAAFVPRRLFGDYVEERINEALDSKSAAGLSSVRGEVVRLLNDRRGGWVSANAEYGSGLSSAFCMPATADCKETPHTIFAVEKGVPIARGVALTGRITNLLNDRYDVTLLNAQGTHAAPPREFDLGIRFGK